MFQSTNTSATPRRCLPAIASATAGASLLFFVLSVISSLAAKPPEDAFPPRRDSPNVILIITDDQGYGDVSAHGSPVLKTPNLDLFREQSIRFTDFHVAPMCSPTRGQLMTGIDAMRNGCTAVCQGRSMIRSELPTMANFFADSGYATGHFGKWHLGDSYPHRPQDRGFQETIHHRAWGITSLADHWTNHTDVYFDPVLSHNGVDKKFEGYCTDIFFGEAMKWIGKQQAANKPFFLYLPTNTPHVPNVCADKYSDPYVGQHEGNPIPAEFYGMIANIDENLGKLENFLEKKKLRDNTILIYMSDNGTQSSQAQAIFNAGMRARKTSVYEGGHRVPCFVRWPPGKLKHGNDIDELTQVQDLLPTLVELCELDTSGKSTAFNGTSLAGLLRGSATGLPDRKLVIQYRTSGAPWDPAVVLWKKWRLVGGKELYHVGNDPGQQHNVAAKHPDIVKAMSDHYDSWYAEAKPLFDRPRWITIGTKQEPSSILYAQDWTGDYCDNRGGLTQARAKGYWNVIVDRPGIYELELRRWPKESDKTLTEGFNGPDDKGPSARPITAANLQIAGANHTLDAKPRATHATFRVNLPAGKTQLATHFLDSDDRTLCSAIYTYLKRLPGSGATLTPTSDRNPKPSKPAPPRKPRKAKPSPITNNQSPVTPRQRPNIVLIFIDDMGYGDIGPFGNTVNQTPHLDRMAEEGNVLRQFYVANTACTPSRSALMTGTYAHRIGMDGSVVFPGEKRGLNPAEITIAEMLREKGYATGCFGKWHLGDQPEFLPLAQGFDEYFGIPYSNDMWPGNKRGNPVTNRGPYTPLPIIRGNQAVAYVADGADQSLLCEVVTDEAVKFIKAHRDEPFFCYVPHAYVHNPRYARPAIMKKAGGDPNRANVEEVDTSVGRILDTLRELKLANNTLVLFTSDNGGAGGMSMGPLRGGKGGPKYEGHMREPTITWWPGTIPAGVETGAIGVTTDLLPSFAKLTGAKVPTDRTIDGKDVLDVLLGKPGAKSPHEIHYYEIDGIRRGKWKLVKGRKGVELYDLDTDIGEKTNLATKHPDIVKELNSLLTAHAEKIAGDTRPAAFVENAKPIISEPGDLPRLRDCMGKPKTKAANENITATAKPAPITNNKSPVTRASGPNILFIAIDDMNDWTTLFDDKNPIQTPNLKRLADRGCLFTRAYCASPGCNPSRTAIMTGLRPTTSGVYSNGDPWRERLPDAVTLPQYFEQHGGYATRGAGKIYHHGGTGREDPDNPSFQEFFAKLPIRGPGRGNNYNGFKPEDKTPLANLAFDWGVHDQKMIDVDMCEWIEARMEENWDRPLFLAAGIFNPHLPFYAPADTFKRYPLDKTVMPPMPEGDLEDVGLIGVRMSDKEAFIYDTTTRQEPGSPGSLKRMIQCYQAASDFADQMVGRLIDKLDASGHADNTIIVLWSDHGYHLGDKECCVKFTLWEKANRVPFIIVAPGVTKPGSRCARPVGLIDIYPTLLDLAGLPPKADNDGQSLVPLLKNPQAKWNRPALMTEGRGNHAIRSDRWRYIRYEDGAEELYDHKNDPWEWKNLAGDPKLAKILAGHRKWLPKKEAPLRPRPPRRPKPKPSARSKQP